MLKCFNLVRKYSCQPHKINNMFDALLAKKEICWQIHSALMKTSKYLSYFLNVYYCYKRALDARSSANKVEKKMIETRKWSITMNRDMGNWSLIYSGKNRRAEHNRWCTWNTWGKGWGISQGLERTHHMILCKLRAGSVGQWQGTYMEVMAV